MIALTNGTIYTMEEEIIAQGTILVDNGKIAAVGADIEIPADAQVIDVAGRMITPGFIDAHTHMGIDEEIHQPIGDDCNEMTEPNTAELRAMDAINYRDLSFQDALKAGHHYSDDHTGQRQCVWRLDYCDENSRKNL